jgi:thiol-disulfide isomerase/thioredoxin
MGKYICLIFLLLFYSSAYAQSANNTLFNATLQKGYPHVSGMSQVIKKLDLTNLKYASLNTGVDSLKVYFGTAVQNDEQVYWVVLQQDTLLRTASFGIKLNRNDTTNLESKKITLNLNNHSQALKFFIQLNPSSNQIFYTWLSGNKYATKALIKKTNYPIKLNRKMPNFTVQKLNGKRISLSNFKGKFVIINWWSTFCGPCRAEIPSLNKLVKKYKSNPRIVFLAIARNKKSEVKKFLSNHQFKYVQTLYTQNTDSIFGKAYPKHVIVNPKGIVTFFAVGGNKKRGKTIEKALQKQLK